MVRDVEVTGAEDAGLEWGIDLGLKEGEEPPTDIEDLSEAQYTIYKMMRILKGSTEDENPEDTMGEKGSGVVVPDLPIG